MPPRKRPTPADAEQFDSSVDRLADQIGLLVQAMDEIREQLHWLATNGIPRWEPAREEQPTTASRPVTVVRDQATLPDSDRPEAELIRQVVERLETGVASIATDQLALFVDALDDARDDLLAALKGEAQEPLDFQDSRDLAGTVVPRPVLPTGTTGREAAADAGRSNHSPTDTTPCVQQAGSTGAMAASDPSTAQGNATPQQRTLFEAPSSAKLTLFEPGDAVEFEKDGTDLFGEIVTLDDGRNLATVMLIPSEEQITVPQDELTKVEPDPLSTHSQQGSTQRGQPG